MPPRAAAHVTSLFHIARPQRSTVKRDAALTPAPLASALRTTRAPTGDFAFASAVAAFGQKLRGDALLADFSYPQIAALAGKQSNFWRQEFIQLVQTADGLE